MMMFPEHYRRRRNSYMYPTIGLLGLRIRSYRNTRDLDNFHFMLLNSSIDTHIVNGYLSIIYWGHLLGRNGHMNPNRALARVHMAVNAIDDVQNVANTIRSARKFIKHRQYNNAVMTLSKLPQLGFAFASKVCAFISGDRCGVIDSVIAHRYPEFGFETTRNGFVIRSNSNANCYQDYCKFLQYEAASMNRLGNRFRWRDRDGRLYNWRAVDIERALYE